MKVNRKQIVLGVLGVMAVVALIVAIVLERQNPELLARKKAERLPIAAPSLRASPPIMGADPGDGDAFVKRTPLPNSESARRNSAERALEPPALDTVREEVARNPHQTPRVVLEFSRELAVRMQAAKSDEAGARALFDELRQCTLQKDGAVSVRVMCLENARRLGRIWPASLQASSHDLERESPANVLRIVRSIEDED